MATRPPEWQMGPPRRRHRTLWSDLAGLWRRFRGLPALVQIIAAVVLLLLAVNLLSIVFGSGDGTRVASRSTTTLAPPTSSTSSTTTIAPGLPAGDDTTVKTVLDGDSLEIVDGTKVRLLGLDAPDVETSACFSAEATNHLKDLLPPGRAIRLVYDTQRTDRFGRTLAYVYRLPDGLFVNMAIVRDGYAIQSTTGSLVANPTVAREIGDAEADAKAKRRGLWGACSTTTTAARAATTAPATTAPAPATTTTTTEPPATTTTTEPTTTSSITTTSVL